MTTAQINASAKFGGDPGGPFELVWLRGQPASSQVGRGQFTSIDSSGYAKLADGTVGFLLPGGIGYPSFVSTSNPTAGLSAVDLYCGIVEGLVQSTINGDGFTDADVCVPFWIADENTPGRLPIDGSGHDRSIGGIVLGMQQGSTTQPRLMSGPVAGLLGLLAHSLAKADLGHIAYAVDGSASTDIASSGNPFIIPRTPVRAKITSIEIVPSADLSATAGNDATITVVKVDTLGVAADVSVGTFTTTTALTRRKKTAFTLTATAADLLLKTTDVLAYYRTHASAGAVIPQSAIRVIGQVI